jgi:hypothetical protein
VFLQWVPLERLSPVVGAALGIDVHGFSQDGTSVATLLVPALEVTGGLSWSPVPALAIEPIATLRLGLRPVPMDIDGGQVVTLFPAAFLAGVRFVLSPAPPP